MFKFRLMMIQIFNLQLINLIMIVINYWGNIKRNGNFVVWEI